jgi:hypothetical protein
VEGMGDIRREDEKHVKDSRHRKVQVKGEKLTKFSKLNVQIDKIWQVDHANYMMSSCKLIKISKLTMQVNEKLTKFSKLIMQVDKN